MLDKKQRINKGRDFRNIYRAGRRINGRYVVVFFRKSGQEYSRVGFVVSKKVGNAVIRNRAKRRLRAIINQIMPHFNTPFDMVINARPGISEASSDRIEKDLLNTLRKAGLC